MSNRFAHRARECALALATLVSGCTNSPSLSAYQAPATARQIPSIALPSFVRGIRDRQATRYEAPGAQLYGNDKFIYTAQLYGNDAKVYRRKKLAITFLETLTSDLSAPQGTVATINGWWYVANAGHSNVLIYRSTNKGPKGPVDTLDDYGQFPGNVDVTPSRQLVAVSNIATTSNGTGSVSIYLKRNAEPARVLTYGNDQLQGIGVAIDRNGDCYWSFNDVDKAVGSIVGFVHCKGTGKLVVPTINYAGGLAFDKHGDLYYVDQTNGIYKCQRTSNCSLLASDFGTPLNINFDRMQKHLWVTDLAGFIDAVNPITGQIEYRTPAEDGSSDPPFGIAADPGG